MIYPPSITEANANSPTAEASNTSSSWVQQAPLAQVALGTAVVALTLLGVVLIVELRAVLLLLFLGVVLGTALAPIATRLRRFGFQRTAATLIAFTLLLLLAVGIVATLVPFFFEQVLAVAGKLPASYAALRSSLTDAPYPWLRAIGQQLPGDLFANADTGGSLGIGTILSTQVPSLGNGLLITALVLLLSYYWLVYREQAVRSVTELLPQGRRAEGLALYRAIEAKIGAFVRGLAIMGLAIGVLSGIGYSLIGLPYALTIAVVAALLEAIPYIGPFITMSLAVLIGFSVSPGLGGLTLLVALCIQFVEGYVVVPRVMDRAVGVHPVVTLLALGVFADLFGLLGAILAIPLAAVFQVLIDRLVQREPLVEQLPLAPDDRLAQVRTQVRELNASLAARLKAPSGANAAAPAPASDFGAWLDDLDGILATRQEQRR